MAELKATVCLQGKDIEVISSHIEFKAQRKFVVGKF